MTGERLLIAAELIEAMLQAARDAAPEECCGLLVGTSGRVTRLVSARNVHDTPHRFFTVDPAAQFALLRELRERGGEEELLGHYHSHPSGPAEPSPRDLAEANDSALFWLVIDPVKNEIGAFRVRLGDSFDRVTIETA